MNPENGTGEILVLDELWRVLVAHRVMALVAVAAVWIAAGAYLKLARPVFEAQGGVYIGSIDGELVDQPVLLIQRLEVGFGRGSKHPSSARLTRVTADRRDQRLISFKVRGPSPEETLAFAEKTLRSVEADHARRVKDATDVLESELRELRGLAETGRRILERANGRKGGDAETAGALVYSAVQLGAMRARIGTLEQSLRSRVMATQVTTVPVLPGVPVQPNPRVVVAFALVAGLFAALLAAFAAESLARRRGR